MEELKSPRDSNKVYSIIGKIALVLIVLAVLVGGGVYIGKLFANTSETNNNTASTGNTVDNTTVNNEVAVANTDNTTNSTDNTTTNSTTNTTTNTTTNSTPTVPDNSTTLSITGKSPFSAYKVIFPNTWSWSKDHVGGAIKLNLSHGGFTVVISQAAGGNGNCVYPGDTSSDPMAASFGAPTEVAGTDSTFRIAMQEGSGSAGDKHLLVCEKTTGDYKLATDFGYISVTTPPEGATSGWTTDNAGVKSILSLLQKQ